MTRENTHTHTNFWPLLHQAQLKPLNWRSCWRDDLFLGGFMVSTLPVFFWTDWTFPKRKGIFQTVSFQMLVSGLRGGIPFNSRVINIPTSQVLLNWVATPKKVMPILLQGGEVWNRQGVNQKIGQWGVRKNRSPWFFILRLTSLKLAKSTVGQMKCHPPRPIPYKMLTSIPYKMP